jgi:hypothetical protein
MPGAAQPREARRGSFPIYQKKDPHPAGDEIFVPAGDLFPGGKKLIDRHRVRPDPRSPVPDDQWRTLRVGPSPKKASLFIVPWKKRFAETEFLCAHKQL